MQDENLVAYFIEPYFPLLLGRSCDLATVDRIQEVELEEVRDMDQIRGQLIPFRENFLPGVIQALPQYFTDEIPRRNLGTIPYTIVSCKSESGKTNLRGYRDIVDNGVVDIYLHRLNIGDE